MAQAGLGDVDRELAGSSTYSTAALHETACSISDAQSTGLDATSCSALLHISGGELDRAGRSISMSAGAAEALKHARLTDAGNRLEYSSQLLGQGGYAQVFRGQVRTSSVELCVGGLPVLVASRCLPCSASSLQGNDLCVRHFASPVVHDRHCAT
jgi:hypothetical protein